MINFGPNSISLYLFKYPALPPRSRDTYVWMCIQCVCPSGELLRALACHPEYKLLSVCSIPQMPSASIAYSTFSWPGMLKHLRQMLISNTKMEEGEFCPLL